MTKPFVQTRRRKNNEPRTGSPTFIHRHFDDVHYGPLLVSSTDGAAQGRIGFMTATPWLFDWPELHRRLAEARTPFMKRCDALLWYFAPAAEFCKRLIGEGRSPANGPRPQDHIASATSIHAFRSAVGSAELSIAGFADIAVTINRSLWEMQLRLFSIRQRGLLGALASLHYDADQHVAASEYEAANGLSGASDVQTYLEEWTRWRNDLRARASGLGWNVKTLRDNGKLNFSKVAAEASQSGSYKTLYRRHSLAAHASGSGTIYANLSSQVRGKGGVLLPLDANIVDAVGDALNQLYLCLMCAAEIIEDQNLAEDIHHAFHHLIDEWLELSPHLKSRGAG